MIFSNDFKKDLTNLLDIHNIDKELGIDANIIRIYLLKCISNLAATKWRIDKENNNNDKNYH